MTIDWNGFFIGMLFGAALYLAGLANPDKIIGTLKLKDLHAMKTIIVFITLAMIGFRMLDMLNAANYSVKPATTLTVLIGGALLGTGFGMAGFCPGTALACAASGRIDAFLTVLGMFAGALFYILIYPPIVAPLEKIWNLGPVTLPQITKIPEFLWVICLAGIAATALILLNDERSGDK